MKCIGAAHAAVTPYTSELDREPSAAELDAIEAELPVITAEVELLDVYIATLDRVLSELDWRRLRRVQRKVLTARRELANQGAAAGEVA
ncbi:DUF6284 family protein [Streptomyces sp. ODS28]|uniref:DUF6284 family protein n=1 Tax=Streptomyces sp. ODS28 TaxID=3136688 RepID=UPI0031EC08BB